MLTVTIMDVDNLSQAQFDMVRRGSDAAVNQTRPILGTVKKIAEGLGYKLGRETTTSVTRDADNNVLRSHTQVQQGFRTVGKQRDADGNVTRATSARSGVPGLFGNRRNLTTITVPNRVQTTRTGGPPADGPEPVSPTLPLPTPSFGDSPTVPLPRPMPFQPGPRGLRPNGNLDRQFWPTPPPTAPRPVQDISAWNQPFNGTQGRSDYGDPRA